MKKPSKIYVVSSIMALTLSLLPLAVSANYTDSSLKLETKTGLHVESGDDKENVNSSTSVDVKIGERDDEKGESDDNEIEVDNDSAENASTTISSSAKVHTRGELRSFLNHLVKDDDRIADIHVGSTTIETHYQLPSRFLWVIPVHLTAEVVVNADGSVTISYPWYGFLFKKEDSKLESELNAVTAANVGASTTVNLSASEQAHLIDLLLSTIKKSED